MIPLRLHLSGFLSYLDPVDLDFSSFELACISGSNGAGKSSLLDAITWVLFGKARRTDDSLINSSKTNKAAEVTFDFAYEGNQYRVQRSKMREKSTVLEFFIRQENGDWRALTEKSTRMTEVRIQNTLRMDYDTFTNASFLLQGRADQFAQQAAGDRKKVLSAILGLEVWEDYRAKAAERRKEVEADVKSLDGRIEEIDRELGEEAARKQRLANLKARLAQAAQNRKSKEDQLELSRRLDAALKEQERAVEGLEQQYREALQRCDASRAELERLREEWAASSELLANADQVQAEYKRWQDLRAALERWESVAANFHEIEARRAAPLAAIAGEESRLEEQRRALFATQAEVERERSGLLALESQRQEAATEIERLQALLNERAALDAQRQAAQVAAKEISAENRSLKEVTLAMRERIDRLGEVEGAVCPLCGQPLSAHEREKLMADLEADGKEKKEHYRANLDLQKQYDAQAAELTAKVAGMAGLDEQHRAQVRRHDYLETQQQRIHEKLETWQAGDALRLAEVTQVLDAKTYARDARAELAAIDEQSRALGYDTAAHDRARNDEREARSAEDRLRALEVARARLAPIQRQMEGQETRVRQEETDVSAREKEYQTKRATLEAEKSRLPDLEGLENEVFSLRSQENALRAEVGGANQSVAVLDSLRARRDQHMAERSDLNLQIARLKSLERAFSKDGVPALLIEQALPEIETHANDILDRLSGGAMSVHFETQRQYKDKSRDDKRETLDIIISDASGPREYELFSGGEAFRVNFAIRLALSRVLAQRAGARLQTLVIDEGFGSQDAEGRQRLIEAINLVRSDFQKILVITHLEELKEAFPARIEVEKTSKGSRVSVMT